MVIGGSDRVAQFDPGRFFAPLERVMRSDIQVAHPDDDAAEVAQKIAEYNLLALPVVDEAGDILGS